MYDSIKQCDICKQEYTSMHVEVKPGVIIHACPNCLEKAKDHFIWICVSCGKSYFRPKEAVLSRLESYGLENASMLCDGVQLILGIDMCIECNPQGIIDYVNSEEFAIEMGACAR
jgi:hypothetical protein